MIQFFSEDIDFELSNSEHLTEWIAQVVFKENCKLGALTYIFCSDEYLHQLNVDHLNHDTLTDIITFPYHESADAPIESDIFISIDRVRENATLFKVPFENELNRVLIHGALHLCGYKDKTKEEEQEMRRKENEALKSLNAG